MTTTVYLSPLLWAAITTTEDVLITGVGFELAYSAAKPAPGVEGHYFRRAIIVPKGAKAWVRSGGLLGEKTKFSSLGATAVEPINIPVFPDNLIHHRELPADGSAIELDGTATGGKAPLTYSWAFNNTGLPDTTAKLSNVTKHGSYNVNVTDADGYTIATNFIVTQAG